MFYSYEEYDLCLKSGEIDGVYIVLPNSMHSAYAIAAANAGIHVLCGKPMATDETECQAMVTASEKNGVKLMIPYRLHFERANLNATEAIRSGKIGKPRIFSPVFTQQASSGNIRLKRDLGGGPVWDIGIYCIKAARYLFQSEPEEVSLSRPQVTTNAFARWTKASPQSSAFRVPAWRRFRVVLELRTFLNFKSLARKGAFARFPHMTFPKVLNDPGRGI